ncbi:MAG: hypothetical protein KC503_34920 [Myxococcales bacterium]|nr:hypothetical protein [Myxococcales bacterium]
MSSTRYIALSAVLVTLAAARADAAPQPVRTLQYLVSGNGFGFQVFDASKMRITQFLERPYRYLRPRPDPKAEGYVRRNLAFDVYFGVRAGSSHGWLADSDTTVEYLEQTNVIHSRGQVGQVVTDSYYFAPYGYAGNAMVMLLKVTNNGGAAVNVDAFALHNFHMGGGLGDENPAANNETIAYDATNKLTSESGPGGGTLYYVGIGGVDRQSCSGQAYQSVKNGQDIPVLATCSNQSDVVNVFQKSLGSLDAGKSAWWGAVVLFESDSNKSAALARWNTFLNNQSADALLKSVLAEWDAWRTPPPKDVIKDPAKELPVWRQSEAVLRMGQVLEPYSQSPKLKNHGMILASLPPGGWHTGWVRDAMYAIVALARTGHHEEARKGLEFFLNAEAGQYKSYVSDVDYRISVVRYYGNGVEEVDYSGQPSPNIETDGWGMFMWAARVYLDESNNTAWLSAKTAYGETIYDVIRDKVAKALEANLEPSANIVKAEAGIWEVHWDNRQHFFYTSAAAARGFCDMAAMAKRIDKTDDAQHWADVSGKVVAGIKSNFLDGDNVLAGSLERLQTGSQYYDGATVEAITWDIFPYNDPISKATLNAFSRLQTVLGGYKRLEGSTDTYDINEWILIDLRVSDAFRRLGYVNDADRVLKWVTDQAAANYFLLPELYDVNTPNGSYTGSIPMVGYGAGAYMMTLLERAGYTERRECIPTSAPSGDGPFRRDLPMAIDGGITPPPPGGDNDGGTGQPNLGATGLACACESASLWPRPSLDLALLALLALAAFLRLRRRQS